MLGTTGKGTDREMAPAASLITPRGRGIGNGDSRMPAQPTAVADPRPIRLRESIGPLPPRPGDVLPELEQTLSDVPPWARCLLNQKRRREEVRHKPDKRQPLRPGRDGSAHRLLGVTESSSPSARRVEGAGYCTSPQAMTAKVTSS